MADVLSSINGHFILSINDVPEIRELFGQFHLEEVSLIYTAAKGKGKKVRELIVFGGK